MIDIEKLSEIIPGTFGEAIKVYPWLNCEPHEWDNRTTIENTQWLINKLCDMAETSCVPQANELLPLVSNNEADCKYKDSCGHDYCNLDECPEYEPIYSEVAVCNCKTKEPCTFTEHGKIVEKCINCAKPIAY